MTTIPAHIKDKFYGSPAWKKIRDYKLNVDRYCQCPICLEYGYKLIATEVHHIEDIDLAWDKRLMYSNLMSVTHNHHSRLTMTNTNDSRDKAKKANQQHDSITERLLAVVNRGET